ncbi:S9 family peptidase [Dysgonomonas sp. 25]|uniref:alpha/beta hydrolase family protein n=1 Tax=Dysgonomonas sp. 25 TaxID=2302933 RepID=UPI0013D38CF6|nr:alpha/beta hydrolase [Dysgonomonas sp. 25]NDV67284.1 alpha/beta hydrolase [Dysgonomonas sp. 25]
MKKFIVLLFTITCALLKLVAQDISGAWSGELNIQGTKLPIVFNIEKSADTYAATMDSPNQGVKNIPTTSVVFENSKLIIKVAQLGAEYEGELIKPTEIKGSFKQSGFTFPLDLEKKEFKINRPQEPQPPFSYFVEDVFFENKSAGIILAGTLTYPKAGNSFPAVVLITGSGAQDRNEEVFGHKPFWVIADYFTKNGIAVLRYDDRGFGKSEGKFSTGTTKDFASDAYAAVEYLKGRKEINSGKIGILGHSEGGLITFMLAAEHHDISFIISMAGAAVQGDSLLYEQRKMISSAAGVNPVAFEQNEELIKKINALIVTKTMDEVKENATIYVEELFPKGLDEDQKKHFANQLVRQAAPWMQYFLQYDPAADIAKIKCPILAINGEKDLQVGATTNLGTIKRIAPHAEIKSYPDLNHLFQHCKTGLVAEYGQIEETISPEVLKDIADWIRLTTN